MNLVSEMTDTEIIEAIGKYNLTIMTRQDRITVAWVYCYGQVREHHNYGLNRGCNDAETIRSVVKHAAETIENFVKPPNL